MSVRVYEFSKQHNIPTKDLLKKLEAGGFAVSSHMSVLTKEEISYLTKEFAINTSEQQSPLRKQPPKYPLTDSSHSKKEAVVQEERPLKNVPASVSIAIEAHSMTVDDFSRATGKSVADVIVTLLKWGIIAAKNKMLTADVVTRLAEYYEIPLKTVPTEKNVQEGKGTIEVVGGKFLERLPVVVVMGHVDHGKTSLLDYIRKSRVAAKEKGGITQHLGAYEAKTSKGNIVFIDTPGHEAFSRMRLRGVKVADIVVLIIAADDSIMPQTIEAIKHAKKMDVPIIVAVNKIDRVDPARVDVVKRDLAQQDLLPEDWGGDVVVVPISAKTGQGVDQLLEMIILQSQLMELTADIQQGAKGYVLESKFEKGRGAVATVLLQHGKIHVGDFFVCGKTVGKVSSLINSYGDRVSSVGPSHPVRIAGFAELPEAGDYFEAVSKEKHSKSRAHLATAGMVAPSRSLTAKQDGFNIIIKTDSDSTKEALVDAIEKMGKNSKNKFNVVRAHVGDIGEGDVSLAGSTKSMLLGLHVKAEPNALLAARQEKVSIHLFEIIYKLLEFLEEYVHSKREITTKRVKTGEAEVRRVFNIKGLGVIAGCYVKDGLFSRDGSVIIWRKKHKVGEGKIKSLQRDKKMVKEVHAGYECAFLVEGHEDWELEDRVECFVEVPDEKSSGR